MRTVLAYLKPHRRYMCLSLTIKVLGTMVELALPYILSHIIQDVIKPMGAEVSPDLAAGSRRKKERFVWAARSVFTREGPGKNAPLF